VVSIVDRPAAPTWALELAGASAGDFARPRRPDVVSAFTGSEFCLAAVRVAGVDRITPADFQARTRAAYAAIARELQRLPAVHPVRFWNFVPDIHAPGVGEPDRYMLFNEARFDAYCAWFGGPDAFAARLPTASAVGHDGDDLEIFCLAATRAGTPVENPRQRPAYRYSRRFGPRPPCFSRAVHLPEAVGVRSLLLVAGTSSVCGEESMHIGALDAQIAETVDNLTAVVRAAGGAGREPPSSAEAAAARRRFRELRIYCTDERFFDTCLAAVGERFPGVERVELARAVLCRRELMVEFEGLAVLE
jgi:chorismate lyase/3-hydroxybenzoate synthase